MASLNWHLVHLGDVYICAMCILYLSMMLDVVVYGLLLSLDSAPVVYSTTPPDTIAPYSSVIPASLLSGYTPLSIPYTPLPLTAVKPSLPHKPYCRQSTTQCIDHNT